MKYSFKRTIAAAVAAVLTLSLASCTSTKDENTLVVGASPTPHAGILEVVKPLLAEKGITLTIKEFTDYVLPNTALENKELDANFFQHKPYLDNFNKEHKTHLTSAVAVHFEPLGIYSDKHTDLTSIPDGAKIAIPNDTSNGARALKLLEANGIIKLKKDADFTATSKDIAENPYNVKIVDMEAAQIPLSLKDVEYAVVNGNYAINGNILDKVIVTESKDSDSAQTYANILAVREGDESREAIKALVEALQSDEVRNYINSTYSNGTVVALF